MFLTLCVFISSFKSASVKFVLNLKLNKRDNFRYLMMFSSLYVYNKIIHFLSELYSVSNLCLIERENWERVELKKLTLSQVFLPDIKPTEKKTSYRVSHKTGHPQVGTGYPYFGTGYPYWKMPKCLELVTPTLELVTPTLELVTPIEKCLSVWNWLPLLKNA